MTVEDFLIHWCAFWVNELMPDEVGLLSEYHKYCVSLGKSTDEPSSVVGFTCDILWPEIKKGVELAHKDELFAIPAQVLFQSISLEDDFALSSAVRGVLREEVLPFLRERLDECVALDAIWREKMRKWEMTMAQCRFKALEIVLATTIETVFDFRGKNMDAITINAFTG